MKNLTITTVGIIYNADGKFIITKRSTDEDHAPGVYSYPGGKLEYNNSNQNFFNLENNLIKEIKEEVNIDIKNIEYLSSHIFETDTNIKQMIAYIAQYDSGEIKPLQSDEIEQVQWATLDEINQLDTFDVVKQVYEQAAQKIKQKEFLHHLSVAGIVLNANGEFLLVRNIIDDNQIGKYFFPIGEVQAIAGSTWEVLEKSLSKNVFTQTGIEINDGAIPFTDESFIGKDGFDTVVQFFICKYKFGEIKINQPKKISEITWKKFEDFDQNEFDPIVYQVFEKANKFIIKLQSM